MTTELLEAMRVATESGAHGDRLAVVRALSAGEVVVPLLERAAVLLEGGAQSLIVNVHGPFGGELDQRELDIVASGPTLELNAYADGVAQFVLADADGAELAVAPDAPAALRNAIVEAAAAVPEVVAVYLLRFTTQGSSHLAAGVRASAPGGVERFLTALQPLLAGDQVLDVFELAPEQLDTFAKSEPVYRST